MDAGTGAASAAGAGTIVRGIVVLTSEAPRLTPCGSATSLDLKDGTAGLLDGVYGELASAQTGELWVELRGEVAGPAFTARALLRALPVGGTDWCASALADGEIRATGHQPDWSVDVRGGRLAWVEPGLSAPLEGVATASAAATGVREWVAELPGSPPRPLRLAVRQAPCRDAADGGWFALTAEVAIDGRTMPGCAYDGGGTAATP